LLQQGSPRVNMSIVNLAPLFFNTVPVSTVLDGYTWGDPVDLFEGQNTGLLPTTDPPVLDLSPARLWNFTQPANSAVDSSQNIPGYGLGTVYQELVLLMHLSILRQVNSILLLVYQIHPQVSIA